jgi:hypothetical protein
MTPFEKRLAKTPLRQPPGSWRSEILTRAERTRAQSLVAIFLAGIENPKSKIQNLLWPHPAAWGALAACWLVIAALNLSGPRGPDLYAVTPAGIEPAEISTERYAAYLHLRDRLLAYQSDSSPSILWLDPRKL